MNELADAKKQLMQQHERYMLAQITEREWTVAKHAYERAWDKYKDQRPSATVEGALGIAPQPMLTPQVSQANRADARLLLAQSLVFLVWFLTCAALWQFKLNGLDIAIVFAWPILSAGTMILLPLTTKGQMRIGPLRALVASAITYCLMPPIMAASIWWPLPGRKVSGGEAAAWLFAPGVAPMPPDVAVGLGDQLSALRSRLVSVRTSA